ncbi:MAG: pyridoxamine 5'-phosphate oxidase family protein [Rhodobacteraceae bacterium]|nr:pyridoxamine 5'-phosphate oxidase family protein [Paracoccaceae bacterium]
MTIVKTIADLEALYGTPKAPSLRKVSDHLTPEYRKLIETSPFCALATVGPEGADASPRGDQGQVVFELDAKTIAIPDRRGNDRIDSLRNIVRDGRVALMFLTPGSTMVTRINGMGEVSINPDLLKQFQVKGKPPRSVILIHIEEIYFQCARAVMRAGLWSAENWPDIDEVPTAGQILAAQTNGQVGGASYDKEWPERAQKTLW